MNAVNPVHSPGVPNAAEPSMEEILASIRRIIADDTTLRPVDASDQGAGHTVRHSEIPAEHHEENPQAFTVEPALPVPQFAEPEAFEPEAFEPEPPQHEPAEPAPGHMAHEASTADAMPEDHGGIAAPHVPPEGPMAEPNAALSRHPLAPPAGHAHVEAEPEPAVTSPTLQDLDVGQVGGAPDAALPHPEPLFSAATDSSLTSAFKMLAASRFVDNSEQLGALVREMIRPLVKAWVDEHLPGLVERLVVAEIERMGRR